MKLLNDATSPFGRKILVAAMEHSISLEEEFVDIGAAGPLDRVNPLRQIPALVTDENEPVYDSDVILQFLDRMHIGGRLFPEGDWPVLTRTSLANGLIEATLQRIMELRRPAQEQSRTFIEKMEARISRVLHQLDGTADLLAGDLVRADQITTACALEYVDFRFRRDWRDQFPALAGWLATASRRSSMAGTAPTRTAPFVSRAQRR
jgi:glutathione S-transferase